jgi:glycosyltransferase involved in cell wall biosynthesis
VNQPRIGILTPFYNSEKWLVGCLDSVAAQDYPKTHYIHALIDDASTDRSFDLVYGEIENPVLVGQNTDAYFYRGLRKGVSILLIKLVKNGKQGRARNFGIRSLFGSVEAFMLADADDEPYPNKVSRMVQEWVKDPETIGFCGCDHDSLDVSNGVKVREFHPPYSKDLLHQSCMVHSQFFFSKLAVQKCGLFFENTQNKEDYGQLLKMSNMFMGVNIPESLNLYRTHPENSSVSTPMEKHREYFDIMAKSYNGWLANPIGFNG